MGELSQSESVSRPPDQAAQASRPETQAPGQAGDSRGSGRPSGPAETSTRAEYARQMREQPPGQRGAVAREARTRPVRPDERPVPDGRDTVAPSPADREDRQPATAVRHFHGEFKSQRLDLYTDGNRWATADSPRPEQTVVKKSDAPVKPPAGQELADSAADNNPSRADRIRSKLYDQSEDALDVLEKNASIGQGIFDRPPTGSYEGTPAPQPQIYETHPAGIDAGTVATAILTLGLVIDRAAHRAVEYYEQHAKGR